VEFRWFWDLTRDFWAENAKNKCKSNKQQQIPFWDATRKAKGNSYPLFKNNYFPAALQQKGSGDT